MTIRLTASVGAVSGIVAFMVSAGTPLSGQARSTPPPLVITAFGGKAVEYKAPRTPWGDPDLQGVWSSDDMENVPMAAGRVAVDAARRRRRLDRLQPLYLDDAAPGAPGRRKSTARRNSATPAPRAASASTTRAASFRRRG